MTRELLVDRSAELYGEDNENLSNRYSVQILSKPNYTEDDIFTVHCQYSTKEARVGWIFPIQALVSSEHKFFGDEHFRIYAQVGSLYMSGRTTIKEIPEDTHLLVLNDERLVGVGYFLENFILSLTSFGYYPYEGSPLAGNDLAKIDNSRVRCLTLIPSPDLGKYPPYVQRLFKELLPIQQDPLARFMSTYQVIEILLERFFHKKIDEQRQIMASIGSIRDHMKVWSSERKLLSGLFSECGVRQGLNDTERSMVGKVFGSDRTDEYYRNLQLSDLIYDVRNSVVHTFHRYRNLTFMSEVSGALEKVVSELLCNAKVANVVGAQF